MSAPIHKMTLCDCADKSATCLGRQEGKACMAHDKWFVRPCDEGKCPGFLHPHCCHKGSTDNFDEDDL